MEKHKQTDQSTKWPDIQNEYVLETYKSQIRIALEGLKLLTLLNGGAAIALLAYMGNIASKEHAVPNLRAPMVCFVMGLLLCGAAFFATYFTQSNLFDEKMGDTKASHKNSYHAALLFMALSLISFGIGSVWSVFRFSA